MIPFFYFNLILIILINILAISIGFLVYKHNPRGKINRTLILMTLFMILWVDFAYIPRLIGQENLDLSLSLLKVAWFVTPLFFASLYFLTIYLLEKEKKYKILTIFVLPSGLLAAFLTGFTNLIVASIRFVGPDLAINYGSAMLPFLGIIIFLLFATLYPLFKEYFKLSPHLKLKLQYFLIGLFLFYLANIVFNIALPLLFDIVRFYWIGDYSTIFLLGFTAYAIVKRELFGIKVILTQVLVAMIAFLLLLDALFFTSDFSFQVIKSIIFFLFLYFGYLLIRSVILEIKNREEMERISSALTVAHIKLEAAYKSLEKLDKAKSEFVSMASHQLKTPLSIIKGYISMMLEGSYGSISDKVKEKLANVLQSNERLLKLVNDLLDISRIELGKMEIERELVQIEDLLQSCVDELKVEAEKKKLKLIFEKPKELLPKINIDSLKIRQVILNLIDNAIKYTSEGEIKVKVTRKNSTILISVQDTGEGLTKEEQKSIFEGFVRGRAGINLWVQGTGIGLWLARKYLELHQGKIWSKSFGKGKGSVFFVELPIK